jgi:hypothetical protein
MNKKRKHREKIRAAEAAKGNMYLTRNDPCACGSGKKAKRCCLPTINALVELTPAQREQVAVAKILRHPQPVPTDIPAAVQGKFAELTKSLDTDTETGPVASVDGPSGAYDFSCNGVQGQSHE